MSGDVHERARALLALGAGPGVSEDEQSWLRGHLQECADCRAYAEAVGRTVSAVRGQPMAAEFGLVQATQLRVRARAAVLRQQRERVWLVGVACLFAGISALVTTPLLWQGFARMGEWAGLGRWVWEAGFGFFWLGPALVVSAFLLAHGTHLSDREG
jgi:predicted anti-sigma-YlaC factor YlaD